MSVTAQLADGRTLEFPDGTDPAVVQQTVKKILAGSQQEESTTSAKNMLGAALEPMTHLATGAIATPIAGILGALTPVSNALGMTNSEPADVVRKISSGLTYEPRTSGGKIATEAITAPLRMVGDAANYAGEKTSDLTGSPAAGAAVNAGLQMLVPGLVGKAAKVMPATRVLPPPLGAAADIGYRAIEPALPSGPADILTRYQRDLAGTAKDKIVAALQAAQELVPGSKPTAGEAISDIPEATALAAHQKAISKAPEVSGSFVARSEYQAGARNAALDTIAQTPEALKQAMADRAANAAEAYGSIQGKLVSPKSDIELMMDAIKNRADSKASALQDQGRFQTIAAENQTRADTFTPVPGMPRVAGRVSEFPERVAEGQAAAADASGIRAQRLKEEQYLQSTMDMLKETVGLDDKALTPLLDRPSMKAAVQDAIKGAQETGSYFPSPGEKFSIGNLQRIKQSLDDAVKDPASFGIKATEAKEIGGTRDAFVKWLSNRSPEWRDARLQYAEDSRPINQMQVGQYLSDKLNSPLEKETPGSFAQAVRDAPGTIKRAAGGPRFSDLGQVLTPEQASIVDALTADLARKSQFQQLASGTNLSGPTAIAGDIHLPNMLSRPAMIVNAVMNAMGHGANPKVNRLAGEQYLNPESLADSITRKTKQEQIVEELLRRRNPVLMGGAAAAGER